MHRGINQTAGAGIRNSGNQSVTHVEWNQDSCCFCLCYGLGNGPGDFPKHGICNHYANGTDNDIRSFTGDNNQQINALWTFKKLNGKWVFYMSEIKTSKPLKISGYDGAQLEAAANIGYTYNNEPVIVFDVRSKNNTNYLALSQSVLVTDTGEFPIQNTEACSTDSTVFWEITSAQPFRFVLPFKGATGKPKAIRFLSFNELDSLGLPINPMTNDEMTFTLSE